MLVATVACLALAACGNDSDPGTATDPGGSSSTSPTPTAEPTVGSYPAFEPTDYSYSLSVSCFCADAGVPIRVTVEHGDVTAAVYAEGGRGVKQGDPVEKYRWLSINDVIDAANDTGAASVDVTWPDGQDYPSSVYVDQDKNAMDEEVGYQVSDVAVTG
ncbi:DUF6174 domain-containing protein [Nocardioides sp.]|uniref:DUF6174 domain-containing protein n=1 Tax=Nocardioides sp. TaxID=35761 RepID=UPI0031FEC53B